MAGDITSRASAKATGCTRYFTGKECSKGHVSERMTTNGTCCACMKLSKDKYKEANPEKVKACLAAWRVQHTEHERNYRAENKDKIRTTSRTWQINNKDRHAYNAKQWRIRNLDRANQNRKSWRATNKDRTAFLSKRWRVNNPEKQRIIMANRNAASRGVRGKVRLDAISLLTAQQGGLCVYCKKELNGIFHIDHIMPIKLKGTHSIDNLQLTCPACNLHKGAQHPLDYARKIGTRL